MRLGPSFSFSPVMPLIPSHGSKWSPLQIISANTRHRKFSDIPMGDVNKLRVSFKCRSGCQKYTKLFSKNFEIGGIVRC